MEKEPISLFCKKRRLGLGSSVNKFAKDHGVSHTYIQDVEDGKKDKPSIAILTKLIKVYDLTKNDLQQLDIEPIFKDDAELFTNLFLSGKFKYEFNLKKQLTNIVENSEDLKGYVFDNFSDKTLKFDRKLSLSFDKSTSCIKYIYDIKGETPDGKECYLNIFNSSQRKISDKDYILYITQMIKMIEGSIEFGKANNKVKKDIELIFATSSYRGYDLCQKLGIDNTYLVNKKTGSKIFRKFIFFDNRKGKKNID